MSFDLTGKIAWITGAGKGIGRSVALALADAGATLALTARTESDLDAVAAGRPGALVLPGSVAEQGFAADCVRRIVAAHGSLDILVNCAGISPFFKRSEKVTDEEWRSVLDVNLDGTYYCARAAGAQMLTQTAGSIVNVSSVHGSRGFPRLAAYAASKGAVEALTKVLAVEWADRDVRVNALAPGYFHTDLSSGLIESRWADQITGRTPMGRIGELRELGGAVVFLASDASSFVTGTTLYVDGGWTAQ